MSTVQEIIDNARFDCSVTKKNCPNGVAIRFFNESMKEIVRKIHLSAVNNDNIIMDKTMNIQAGQGIYDFPSGDSKSHDIGSVPQLRSLIDMSISLNGKDFHKVRPTHYISSEQSTERLREHNPTQAPKIIMHGATAFEILPTPTMDVVGGIRMSYNSGTIDLDINATESDIPVPHEYHEVISLGMHYRIHRYRRKIDEANVSKAEYIETLDNMITEISTPYMGFIHRDPIYPNSLMY